MKGLSNISAIGKVITIAFSIIGGAAGGIVIYNGWIIDRHDTEIEVANKLEQITEIRSSFESVIDTLTTLSLDVREVARRQKNIQDEMIDLTQANDNLRAYMINKALDKDEVLDIIHIWEAEKKKISGD